MASFVTFLRGLLEEGSAVLRDQPHTVGDERSKAETLLAEAFADHRLDVAGPSIAFDADTALTSAEQLWFACWFLLHHGEPPAEVEKCLGLYRPPVTASQHLSADLVLRFAPRVYQRARRVDATDILTKWLEQLLRWHPLAGVLSDLEEGPLAPVHLEGHPGLLLLYAERLAENPRLAWTVQGPASAYIELVFVERGLSLPALQLPQPR
jgi:MoxR-vWA-beta-propeller ternary system domain bpX4